MDNKEEQLDLAYNRSLGFITIMAFKHGVVGILGYGFRGWTPNRYAYAHNKESIVPTWQFGLEQLKVKNG